MLCLQRSVCKSANLVRWSWRKVASCIWQKSLWFYAEVKVANERQSSRGIVHPLQCKKKIARSIREKKPCVSLYVFVWVAVSVCVCVRVCVCAAFGFPTSAVWFTHMGWMLNGSMVSSSLHQPSTLLRASLSFSSFWLSTISPAVHLFGAMWWYWMLPPMLRNRTGRIKAANTHTKHCYIQASKRRSGVGWRLWNGIEQ